MKLIKYTNKVWPRIKQVRLRHKIIGASIIMGVVLLVVPILTYAYFARDISNPERLMNRNNTGIILLDRNNEPFYTFGNVGSQDNMKLSDISDEFEHALVASEDESFYKHSGYSVRGVLAALYANVLSRDSTRYGGSTITQQLVKNTLLSNSKDYLRKYQEVSMAIAIERRYSKDEILQMYINSVYFGEGAFGIKQAAKAYYNKVPKDLTAAESAMLVGLLPAPSTLSPISGDATKAGEHQARVLRRMVEAGYITNKQKDEATKQELVYATPEAAQKHAQHFAMMVLDELKTKYGEETITRSGYRVTTGLDLNWQKQAEQQVRERVDALKGQGGSNGSLVATDPRTGQIRALVGSADWNNETFGKVNMAVSPRQPGSSFKPIYYAEALEKRHITASTIIKDQPKSYGNYTPQNYDFRFRGDISVRNALGQSLNIPSIEVIQKLGVEEAAATARRMGISDINDPEKYGLTLALGTAEAKLLDMTNAYAALANYGNQYKPVKIVSIKDKYDKTIFAEKARTNRVQSAEASFLMSSILSDNTARAPTFGSSLNIPKRQVAVKTGTTDDYRDAWTIGYTPSLTVGVWVGNNDNQPMAGVAGSVGAGVIWKNSMNTFLGDSPTETFEQPANITKLAVCRHNGLTAVRPAGGTYEEYFIKGGEPAGTCETIKRQEEKKEEPRKDDDKKKEEEPANGVDEPETDGGRGATVEPTDPVTTPTEPEPTPEPIVAPTEPPAIDA